MSDLWGKEEESFEFVVPGRDTNDSDRVGRDEAGELTGGAVDSSDVDARASFAAFQDRFVNFGGSVGRDGAQDRIRRLELELESLESSGGSDSSLSEAVSMLRSRLGRVKETRWQGGVGLRDKVVEVGAEVEEEEEEEEEEGVFSLRAADLEKRLRVLESAVGGGGVGGGVSNGLGERVRVLSEQMELLLSVGSLDAVGRRARAVTSELEAVSRTAASVREESGVDDEKVRHALETIQKWEEQAGSVPIIAGRLRALGALHAEAAMFASRLDALERGREEIETQLRQDVAIAKSLQENAPKIISKVNETIASLTEK